MNRTRVRRSGALATIAAFALVVLAACGSGGVDEAAHEPVTRVPVMSDAAAQATREAASGATPGAEGEAPVAADVTVQIDSHDIFFEPSEVTIPANTDVKVVLPNLGAAVHNFSIDELDVSVDIAPGATEEVIINAPAGEYEFVCDVPGHKEAGMVGTLIVSDDAAAAAPAGEATPAEGVPAATPAATAEEAPADEAAAPAAASDVTITSYDIYFEPSELSIPANTDVRIILPNEGVTLHNFSITEHNNEGLPFEPISVDIAPGATEEVVLNAPPGEYYFFCDIPGHEAAGMFGTLTVTDEAGAAPAEDAAPVEEATPAAEAPAEEAAQDTAPAEAAASAAAGPVEVASYDIYFDPNELTIPANTDVTFTLPNNGVTLHDFTIDALGIAVTIEPGGTEEVVINAPAGEYEFYCSVPGHKAAGMVGTLIVSGDAAPEEAPAEPVEAEQEAADDAAPADEPADEETAPAAEPAAAAEPVTVASHDIYFEPAEITIPADTDVTFMLPNEGVTLHDFSIDALGIAVDIAPGETQEVVINAPAGEYEFYCSVPGHKAAGMVGTLIVTGDAAADDSAAAEQEAASAEAATPDAASVDEADEAEADADAAGDAAAAGPVEVVSYDIYFEPSEATIPADTDVTFTLPNDGVTLHNFAIDALDIDVDIAPGETEEVVINAPAGEYEFYCNVPGHKAAGMVGTLTVQ